jgi:transcriptional regulator of acetoin/glycerol metabolism
MGQKPTVLYLRMKGMAVGAIHDDLVRTLWKDVATYSTLTKYAGSAQFSSQKEATSPEASDVERNPVDEAILTALAGFPFSSVRELSRRICLPRSTVYRHRRRHLTQSPRFTV